MGLLIGGLVAVIGLILYEQSKKIAPAQSTVPLTAAGIPTTLQPPVVPVSVIGSATGADAAAALLPQFDSTAASSLIDLSQSPVLTGGAYHCQGGSVAYYDPRTATVYCVIPGGNPASENGGGIDPQNEDWTTAVFS